MAIATVFVLAVIVEALLEVLKQWLPTGLKIPTWAAAVGGGVLGIGLCLLAGVDLLALAGITLAIPVVGEVLTGILISRGASFVHDLWGKINESKVEKIEQAKR